jgi:Spy/CpxP family protein refolding chaperone
MYSSKQRTLIWLVVLLSLLNISTLGFIIWHKMHKKRNPKIFPQKEAYKDVSGIIKKELSLSDDQALHFESIREKYYTQELALAKVIKAEKDSMNAIMFNIVSDETKLKSLAHEISINEEKMEYIRIAQAKDLKSVCNKEQLERFETLVKEIRDYFRPDNRPNQK